MTMNENACGIYLSVVYDIYLAVDPATVYIGQERWPEPRINRLYMIKMETRGHLRTNGRISRHEYIIKKYALRPQSTQ